MSDTDQRIRELAYFLWQEEGCPEGEADRHWRRAETMIEAHEGERKTMESEGPADMTAESVAPLSTLKRSSSSRAR